MSLAAAKAYAVAAYNLNESSGTRADASGLGYDLTDHNTVGSGTGIIGNAAEFISDNNEYLDVVGNSGFEFGDGDATVTVWLNSTSLVNLGPFVSMVGDTNKFAWYFDRSTDKYSVLMFADGSVYDVLDLSTTVDTGAWHLLCFTYTASTNQMTLSLDAGTRATHTQANGNGFYDLTSPQLSLGGIRGINAFDGLLDEVVLLKGYAFSTADEAALWNSGACVAFADWAPARQQSAYRWRNDDGSESAATWAAAENTPITLAKLTPRRLRVQVDTSIDTPSEQIKLQYRKVGDVTWLDVN